jgi:hypothetical protein
MANLTWYARRLRSMDGRELLWRIGRAARPPAPTSPSGRFDALSAQQVALDWDRALQQFREGTNRPVLLDGHRAFAIAERRPRVVSHLLASADRVIEYSFSYFGYPEVSLPRPIDWNLDPLAGVRWPDAAADRIDHRTVAQADVKWIWELNRLQHLPWLAQAWLFTGDSRYSAAAFEQLDSWIEQNPPGHGIAWRGAFEAGIRAISIAVALQGLRDAPELTVERYRRIVRVLADSASRCWRDRSRFSSANNHLIGEMAGLATVAMIFPELALARQWETRALRTLSSEADRQILPDGSGAEQAVGYQLFTVELLHLVAFLLTQRDGEPPQTIVSAIRRSSDYLAAVVGDDDSDPRYGDNDDGFALRLGPETLRTVRDHLGIVASLGFGAVGLGANPDTLAAQWFFEAAQSLRKLPSPARFNRATTAPQSHFASDGGLVVLRGGRRRITMDVGPLGHLSIAAHGHADALAVTLGYDGRQLIDDPGTGSYYGNPQWRSVMRGTSAHATVTVDGQDQSVAGGAFLWSKHAHTTVRGVDLSAGIVDAEHDGYTRLKGRVTHRRWLIAPPDERAILIVDLIGGTGSHEVRTAWPLHPDLDVRRIEGGHALCRDDLEVLQILYAGTTATACDEVRGDEARNLGWWSQCLEARVPAWWLGATCVGEIPLAIATLLTPVDGVPTRDLSIESNAESIEATWHEAGTPHRVTIDVTGSAAVRHGQLDPSTPGMA